jgi:hypothetical protein
MRSECEARVEGEVWGTSTGTIMEASRGYSCSGKESSGRASERGKQGRQQTRQAREVSKGGKQGRQAREASKGGKQGRQAREANKGYKQGMHVRGPSNKGKQGRQAREAIGFIGLGVRQQRVPKSRGTRRRAKKPLSYNWE